MLGKYIGWTRIYLMVLTVLIALRFLLEAAGADNGVTSELSVTRLYFVLPVFLGIRFATENSAESRRWFLRISRISFGGRCS